ncbi:MAG TPA: hypothetical protein VFQ22_02820 [Longimicrobiales bacterium]|nr:hypothetical protein [Longimicrobiales bacterium]
MRRSPLSVLARVAATTLITSACAEDGSTIVGTLDVRDYIAAVSTQEDVEAVFHEGAPPQPGEGPSATASGISAMITGGTAIRTLEGSGAFTTIYVSVANTEGYWELTLPNDEVLLDLLLSVAQNVPAGTFMLRYAIAEAGDVGAYYQEFVTVLNVGTGLVQVSVSWDTDADVDLYVEEPGGEEIYYGSRNSASGGELDLDSNAACAGDNVRNENITWPEETPPSGTYEVRVNLWDDCGAASTNWVVTVHVEGQPLRTFSGVLDAPGVGGGEGAGELVTTFTYP